MSSKEGSEISSPDDDTLRDERQRGSEPNEDNCQGQDNSENFHLGFPNRKLDESAGWKRKHDAVDDSGSVHKMCETAARRQPPLGVVRQLCREAAERRFQDSLSGRSFLLDPLTSMEKQFDVPPA
mmetsp:Transcript_23037/g.75036  ORF Transcript_23037/g.75036 Transcript_23037/m.75036 type:complete len:125 (-) Transcript_23037:172-546(-)